MGMTLDYNLAQNGSNMIRIGSKIFVKEMYKKLQF